MDVAVPLVEGNVPQDSSGGGDATGSGQASAEEVVAAMENFKAAAAEAAKCLDDLSIYQQKMKENQE